MRYGIWKKGGDILLKEGNFEGKGKIMILRFLVVVSLLCVSVQSGFAVEQRGDLILYKEPLYEIEDDRKNACVSIYDVDYGKNVDTMRHFRDFWCQGRYTLTVAGDKDRVVTLFAEFNYKKDRGFMVLRKLDDRKVWLINLEDVPPGKWVRRKANEDSGGVEIFFYEKPQFSQRISSVKWGQWWHGSSPVE